MGTSPQKLLIAGGVSALVTVLSLASAPQSPSIVLMIGAGIVALLASTGVCYQLFRGIEQQTVKVVDDKQREVLEIKRVNERLQQGTELLKKRVSEVLSLRASLQTIARQTGQSLEYKKIVSFILGVAERHVKARRCSIWILDPETHELVLEEDLGWSDPDREAAAGDKRRAIFNHVLHEKPGYTYNSETAKRDPTLSSLVKDSAVPSEICSPLAVGGEVLGVLNIEEFKERGQASMQDDVQLIAFLASLAAMALKNARLFEQTQEKANTDGLTRLLTHRRFQEMLDQEIKRAERYGDAFSLVLTDIDHFKKFNDTYGHQIGDLVLRETAQVFRTCGIDKNAILARYGGEEFIIILPHHGRRESREVAEHLRHAVETREHESSSGRLKVTISLGVSTYPDDSVNKGELIKLADAALYRAKAGGRNRVFSAGELDEKVAQAS